MSDFNRNGGSFRGRRRRRGISKFKQNEKKLEEALRKIQQMENLQEKVNLLDSERQKKVEEEQKLKEEQRQKTAAEDAKKSQEEAEEKIKTLLVNVFKDQSATFFSASVEAAKKNKVEEAKSQEVHQANMPKKPWFSWLWK